MTLSGNGLGPGGLVEVRVDLYGGFREAVGTSCLNVKLSEAETMRGLLQHLTANHDPRFQSDLLEENGVLRHDAVLLLNEAVMTIRDL